jgi:hypothetical protein
VQCLIELLTYLEMMPPRRFKDDDDRLDNSRSSAVVRGVLEYLRARHLRLPCVAGWCRSRFEWHKRNPKDHKLQEHFDALEAWSKEDAARETKYKPILDKVKLLKNVVMNPCSHPDDTNIPKRKIQEAIDAVDALIKELGKK